MQIKHLKWEITRDTANTTIYTSNIISRINCCMEIVYNKIDDDFTVSTVDIDGWPLHYICITKNIKKAKQKAEEYVKNIQLKTTT